MSAYIIIPIAIGLFFFYNSNTNGDLFGIQTLFNGLFLVSTVYVVKAFIILFNGLFLVSAAFAVKDYLNM